MEPDNIYSINLLNNNFEKIDNNSKKEKLYSLLDIYFRKKLKKNDIHIPPIHLGYKNIKLIKVKDRNNIPIYSFIKDMQNDNNKVYIANVKMIVTNDSIYFNFICLDYNPYGETLDLIYKELIQFITRPISRKLLSASLWSDYYKEIKNNRCI